MLLLYEVEYFQNYSGEKRYGYGEEDFYTGNPMLHLGHRRVELSRGNVLWRVWVRGQKDSE